MLGFGIGGLGLAILAGVVPHEDPIVGLGLLAFGVALVVTGRMPMVRPWSRTTGVALVVAGLAALALSIASMAGAGRLAGPQTLLAAVGLAMVAGGPFPAASVGIGKRRANAASALACLLAATAAPLAVWSLQAAFKRASGDTPLEWFEATMLVIPVHAALVAMGLQATASGQNLVVMTSRGPLGVEVGVACSGLQAMALFLGVLALFAITQRPPGKRLAVWCAVGLFGVYVANVLRLITIVLAGWKWGAGALVWTHANAGWAFFVVWSLVFAWWVRRDLGRMQASTSRLGSQA